MLLGIDLGTSALKAMVFDPESGRVLASVREPVSSSRPTPERAEMDAEELWRATVRVLTHLRTASPEALGAVRGVGLSTIFPALVPMDSAGAPVGPVMLYCDRRSVPQVEALAASFGRERFELLTGNQLTPGTCTLPGILWLRDEEPERFRKARVFGQVSTFLVHRLTGEWVVDPSHTSLSGMVRSGEEGHWCAEILDHVGLPAERLPTIRPAATVAGVVSHGAAAATGLPAGVPVVAGCGDAPLAALGGGVVSDGQLFCSAGTTDCLMFSGTRPSGNPIFCNVTCAIPDLWVAIGTMSTAGASVQWFCERFMHCTPAEMTRWAEQAEPGAGRLQFLPYLQGERTPWWDPRARGMFFGLDLTTGREEACRAVFEGIACGWRQIISLLEAEYKVRAPEIIAVGGGSTNPLLNRIKATLLDRPVRALSLTEGTSLGAALIGGLGAGVFATPREADAVVQGLREGTVFEPVAEWKDTYDAVFDTYLRLYPTTKSLL